MHALRASEPTKLEQFRSNFNFRAHTALLIGIERECFLKNEDATLVAMAPRAIEHIHGSKWRDGPRIIQGPVASAVRTHECVGYELSAVQLETRTPPHAISRTRDFLRFFDANLRKSLREIDLRACYDEVAPADMPLDVYPDPSGRYQRITAQMPREILLAACRIIGTHVHVGMPDHETALRVYNKVVPYCSELVSSGDNSNGQRMQIYGIVKKDHTPHPYASWDHFCDDAYAHGFAEDVRSNWRLIRITKHGTIEFRMFGATDDLERIHSWAERCHSLCAQAMK